MQENLNVLLKPLELVPSGVQEVAARLEELGIWHQFSRNYPAMSCQDAARKRNRLGHCGIPLWDELKSFLGWYRNTEGVQITFLAHCRGDRELDMIKLQNALGSISSVERLSLSDVAHIGTAYGVVNPFALSELPQIFDFELMRVLDVPGTIMTNAGEHTWAVEFDPRDLVLKLPSARWADVIDNVIQPTMQGFWGIREPEIIGILTGNPIDSGLGLSHSLSFHIRRLLGNNSLGDVSMPKIVLLSSPQIGISMEMDVREKPLIKALMDAADELTKAGAKIIAHPAHTTHRFAPELQRRISRKGARFISIVDTLVNNLRNHGIKEIALLGTKFVTDIDSSDSVYHKSFEGILVHKPSNRGWKKIHELAYEVQQGGATSKCFNLMRDILKEEVPPDCKYVVLAMTEFSPILNQLKERGRHGKILIDPIEYYGEALAREYLGLRPEMAPPKGGES